MATSIYLGYPPENIKKWIKEHVVIEPAESPLTKIWFADEPDKCYEYDIHGSFQNGMVQNGLRGDGITSNPYIWTREPQKITVGTNVTYFDQFQFQNSTELLEIIFPSTISIIEDGMFCDCPKLTEIVFPIGFNTFNFTLLCFNCNALTKISFLDKIELPTSGTYNIFNSCPNLKSIFFKQNTIEEVQKLVQLPVENNDCIIYCSDGNI